MIMLNKHLLNIIHKRAISKQFVYDEKGLLCTTKDPLYESYYSPVKGLIHRYPDRVLLTLTNKCFAYCKFCFRKKNWKNFEGINLDACIQYIKRSKDIKEVILSGGDPFILSNNTLDNILTEIDKIKHIYFIRIGTRTLTTNPKRFTKQTINMLSKHKTIWLAIHVNHKDEITNDFISKTQMLIKSGIPIISQTVLLKGINDNISILKELFYKLVLIRIKPYYIFNCDSAEGNEDFMLNLDDALKIVSRLRGNMSGICVPTFAFDLDGGGGKIVLEKNSLTEKLHGAYKFINFEGKIYEYKDKH